MCKISIVIPMYNAQKYMRRTLGSVIKQSFENYEVIIIDDGSTDNSHNVCKEVSADHNNIHIIRVDNAGVANARKLGAEKANGEYIFFLDADDCLHPDCLKELYHIQNSSSADLTIGACARQNEQGEIVQHKGNASMSGKMWEKEYISLHGKDNIIEAALNSWRFCGDPFLSAVWGRLYRKNVYLEITAKIANSFTTCEDFVFNAVMLANLNHIEVVNKPLYIYTMHDEASTLSSSLFNQPDFLKAYEIVYTYTVDILVNGCGKSHTEASAKAYNIISYQLIGNYIYNYKYYSKANHSVFVEKTKEMLSSELVKNSLKHHTVPKGYSKVIPLLMKAGLVRLLIYTCKRRAKKRYK